MQRRSTNLSATDAGCERRAVAMTRHGCVIARRHAGGAGIAGTAGELEVRMVRRRRSRVTSQRPAHLQFGTVRFL